MAAGAGGTGEREPGWYLEMVIDGGHVRRIPIEKLPFRIGRRRELELVLPDDSVSKSHAEIQLGASGLRLKDLGSVNGTFVNRTLVEEAELNEGDVLRIADFEFRLGRMEPGVPPPPPRPTTAALPRLDPTRRMAFGTRELKELVRDEMVTMVFQPIRNLGLGTVTAYEALGRGRYPGLTEDPKELFRIAESVGMEAQLSRLFRRRAVELAAARPDMKTLFLNTHPMEFSRPGLLESLEDLRGVAPSLALALEIHESVLTPPATIAALRRDLEKRDIALAYDDFGAGQARLLELADAPPHYLKFDRQWVIGLDKAPRARESLLHSLLGLARELGMKTIAEGIESAAEERACFKIGFDHAQGFHLGHPRPIEEA
jgi:EAL domain-containing protein (putative c-di-GMP-specific phosphodiesterase class I)